MYFSKFPIIYYPYEINGELIYKQVSDITINVRLTKALLEYATTYDIYDMKEGETPEIIAERAYGSPLYHWVVMICNERYDYLNDFPLSNYDLEQYIIRKYGTWEYALQTHHYVDEDGFIVSTPQVTANNVTVDQLYKIVYPGTTNFRTIGSHSNEQGTIFTAKRNVTFKDTGDLVTYNNHNLINGDTIKFSTITTTTGISINTTYYVINVKKNTFQLSLTSGGSAIALTNNGTEIGRAHV